MPHTVALDVGSYTVKAVQGKKSNPPQIDRTVEVFNTTGVTVPPDDQSVEKLAGFINTLFQDHALGRTDVRLSLPENVVSTKIISIPTLTDAELASAINWQAEQHIPIPLDELSLEYQVISRPSGRDKNAQMKVLLVGVRKSVVEKYLDVFLRAGIEPTLLETQVISVLRSLQFTPDEPTTLVVHMGATITDFVIVDEGELSFVYSHASGGQVLTRAIEQGIQLDPKQAEQYKRTYGLDPNQFEGKIKQALLPVMKMLVVEIQKAIQFFVTQKPGGSVKRILLSGGSAQLPGFIQFLAEQLGAEVLIAAPFGNAKGELPNTNHPAFAVCMGLLMRDI